MKKVDYKSVEESPPEEIQASRLFDEFLIIGADPDDIQYDKPTVFANPKT